MANMLNDCEISPTNYMIAFLRQRGWQMPEITMRIPNVIPEVDPIAAKVGPSLSPVDSVAAFQLSCSDSSVHALRQRAALPCHDDARDLLCGLQ